MTPGCLAQFKVSTSTWKTIEPYDHGVRLAYVGQQQVVPAGSLVTVIALYKGAAHVLYKSKLGWIESIELDVVS